jgi:hypothetical protein
MCLATASLSCLALIHAMTARLLRVNGDGLKDGDKLIEVKIEPKGEPFTAIRQWRLQAEHFQTYYDYLPDATLMGMGVG